LWRSRLVCWLHAQSIDDLRAHAEQGTPTRSSPYQARKSSDDASLPVIRDRILTEVDVEQRPA
jgi:hypothetical protein